MVCGVKPRSGVLSIVCGFGGACGPRSGYLVTLVNRFWTPGGNRYAAHRHRQTHKLSRGHRYAVIPCCVVEFWREKCPNSRHPTSEGGCSMRRGKLTKFPDSRLQAEQRLTKLRISVNTFRLKAGLRNFSHTLRADGRESQSRASKGRKRIDEVQ